MAIIVDENGNHVPVTDEQIKALQRKYQQDPNGADSFEDFCSKVQGRLDRYGTLMLFWCNMWLGIETDGYTHS